MTRRFYPGGQSQQAPGRDIDIGIRLQPPATPAQIAPAEPAPTPSPRLVWSDLSTDKIITTGYAIAVVLDSAADWTFSHTSADSGYPMSMLHAEGIAATFFAYEKYTTNEHAITATSGSITLGPIYLVTGP